MSASKVTTLSQMEMAAVRGLQAAGGVAEAAAAAIEEVLDIIKADKSEPVSITILTTGWISDDNEKYPFYYDISVENITDNDRAEITIAPENLDTAKSCGLCPTNETSTGIIRLRSTDIPTEEIAAEYWLEVGKE